MRPNGLDILYNVQIQTRTCPRTVRLLLAWCTNYWNTTVRVLTWQAIEKPDSYASLTVHTRRIPFPFRRLVADIITVALWGKLNIQIADCTGYYWIFHGLYWLAIINCWWSQSNLCLPVHIWERELCICFGLLNKYAYSRERLPVIRIVPSGLLDLKFHVT